MYNIIEQVHSCNLCKSQSFINIKTKPTTEWEAVKKYYRDNNEDSIFLKIPETFSLVKCSSCGLVFVNPRLVSSVVNEFYNLYLSGKFSNYLPPYEPQFRSVVFESYIKILVSKCPKARNILDIGCAYGSMMKQAQISGLLACGIEISPVASECAKQYGVVYTGDAFNILKNIIQRFDIITLIDSLEHLSNPIDVLQECFFRLNSNGIIFIEVPNLDCGIDEMSRHFYLFSESTLRASLEKVGFSNIELVNVGSSQYNSSDGDVENRFLRLVATK